ncbi:alpha-tocopherol transfer protein-like [Prorops nasuta]|uniref:alpha-tocopherol transfer protein-like n=1 Tax=Prorops nasuta TaxID=863751 RepID=UPI0034CD0E4A
MALARLKPSLEDEMKRNPELKLSDLKILREWLSKQPHLPQNLDDIDLAMVLHSNYFRLEPTKTNIEKYFTIRTHVPEFFSDRDPLGNKGLRQAFQTGGNVCLKGKTKEGYSLIYGRLVDADPTRFVYNDMIKFFFLMMDLLYLSEGTKKGLVYVADAIGVSIGHVSRTPLMSVKKMLTYVQEAAPVRLKGIHIINVSHAMELVFNMAKPFMHKNFFDLIHFHSSLESLEKAGIPIEFLPNESGGKAGLLKDLANEEVKKIENNRNAILEYDQMAVAKESLRIGKSLSAGELFGVEGSFKKLEID